MIDINSRSTDSIAKGLSNFCNYTFYVDGILCNSMEGWLQSLKFKDIHMQKYVCLMIGYKAKKYGRDYGEDVYKTGMLYWMGKIYGRLSSSYQDLLDDAFSCLYLNITFRGILFKSGSDILMHSRGSNDITKTILTVDEFCSRLTALRELRDEHNI